MPLCSHFFIELSTIVTKQADNAIPNKGRAVKDDVAAITVRWTHCESQTIVKVCINARAA